MLIVTLKLRGLRKPRCKYHKSWGVGRFPRTYGEEDEIKKFLKSDKCNKKPKNQPNDKKEIPSSSKKKFSHFLLKDQKPRKVPCLLGIWYVSGQEEKEKQKNKWDWTLLLNVN